MAEVARFHGGPRVRRRDCGSAKGAFSCPMMTYRADRTAPMLLTRCGAKRKEAARRHASRRPPRWMQCISSPPPPNERLAPMPTHVEREGLGKDWRIDPGIFQRLGNSTMGFGLGPRFTRCGFSQCRFRYWTRGTALLPLVFALFVCSFVWGRGECASPVGSQGWICRMCLVAAGLPEIRVNHGEDQDEKSRATTLVFVRGRW